jgi:hypothetical protein
MSRGPLRDAAGLAFLYIINIIITIAKDGLRETYIICIANGFKKES